MRVPLPYLDSFTFFFSDEKTGVLALLFFSVFLLGLLIAVWVGIIGMIKKENSNDYKKITSFTSFETNDGIHGVYEVFKIIQSKRVFLQQIDHNFKWSGSKMPAKLLKKPIESVIPAEYKQYGSVPFDQQSKSYQHCMTDPEIGFYYRLEWEK